jgi:NADPH:quinone reductase
MEAILLETHGGPEVLQVAQVPDPVPGPDEVLVEVAAAGVNFIDTYQRSGLYDIDLPGGLGLEGAGEVVAVGAAVTSRQVGDVVAWADRAARTPSASRPRGTLRAGAPGVEPEEAAALMLQGMTAHYLTHSTRSCAPGRRCWRSPPPAAWDACWSSSRSGAAPASSPPPRRPRRLSEVRSLGADEVILYRDVDVAQDGPGADRWRGGRRRLRLGRPGDLRQLAAQPEATRPAGPVRRLLRTGAARGPADPQPPRLAVRDPPLAHAPRRHDRRARVAREQPVRAGARGRPRPEPSTTATRWPRRPAHRDLESGTTSGKLLVCRDPWSPARTGPTRRPSGQPRPPVSTSRCTASSGRGSLEEAAERLGVAPDQMLKTLVVRRAEGDHLLVLLPGTPSCPGRSCGPTSASRGCRSPTPTRPEPSPATSAAPSHRSVPAATLPVLADASIAGAGTVTIGAGAHGVSLRLDADDLLAAVDAEVVELT